MKNLKRTLVTAVLVFTAHLVFVGSTLAADTPVIQAVTHAGFGGGTDVTTRMMLLRARKALKQDMQLVNKKGGGGAAGIWCCLAWSHAVILNASDMPCLPCLHN